MEDGWYRLIPKEGTTYDIVRVEDDRVFTVRFAVYNGDPVEEFIARSSTFTKVYPIHISDDLYELVHNDALAVSLSDDDVVETAVRNFFIYFRLKPKGERTE